MVVATSMFTEDRLLWDYVVVIDNCLGCLTGAHAKRRPILVAPVTRFGVMPYSSPCGSPSMNNESIIWRKLLPSRQHYVKSTAKTIKMGCSHINFSETRVERQSRDMEPVNLGEREVGEDMYPQTPSPWPLGSPSPGFIRNVIIS